MTTAKTFTPRADFLSLNADQCKALMGFRTELAEGEKSPFTFTDGNGARQKFVLDRNKSNRPFTMGLAKRYKEMLFRGDFAGQPNSPSVTCNGESMIIDADGNVVSAAHRAVGLILAQEEANWLRKCGQTEILEEFDVPEVITLPTLLVQGIDPSAADTNDTGKIRSVGDVYFRRTHFANGKEIPDTAKVILTRELATATRLVWLRLRGEQVAGGGKFSIPEAVAFSDTHPLLIDALLHVYAEDGGKGDSGKKISAYLSLGYAAAMMYLFGFSTTPRSQLEDGSLDLRKAPANWKYAEMFWTYFSQFKGGGMTKDQAPAIFALHSILNENRKSQAGKISRDELCSLCVRAWLGYAGTEEDRKNYISVAGLKKKLFRTEGTGDQKKEYLDLTRLGGFDLDYDILLENEWVKKDEKFIRKMAGEWKAGDTCWVNQPKIGPWYGTIISFNMRGSEACIQTRKEDNDTYDGHEVVQPDGKKVKYDEIVYPLFGVTVKKGEPKCYIAKMVWLSTEQPKPVVAPPAVPPVAPASAAPPIKKTNTSPPVAPAASTTPASGMVPAEAKPKRSRAKKSDQATTQAAPPVAPVSSPPAIATPLVSPPNYPVLAIPGIPPVPASAKV